MKRIAKQLDKQNQILVCQRCTHEWNYKGYNPFFTLCPHCSTTVRTNKNKITKSLKPVQVGGPIQAPTVQITPSGGNEPRQ